MTRFFHTIALGVAILGAGCATVSTRTPAPPLVARTLPGADSTPVPLNEMGARTYKSLQGGLYPAAVNIVPADQDAIGIARRNAITPLSANGSQSQTGRIVLMSVGSAVASSAWCSVSSAPPCSSWSFTGKAVTDPSVNHGALVIVNGAFPNTEIGAWSAPTNVNYNRIRDTRLAPLGLSENQVQAIWMNLADSGAAFSPVASAADASTRLQRYAAAIRALKQRYPNLRLLFLSSAAFGGHLAGGEPGAYESAFIVRWVIESQINQSRSQASNPDVGDLLVGGAAPWISWGPYLWTNAEQTRSDGWSWLRSDTDSSGRRLSPAGEAKMGAVLLEFFKNSPYTRCWFLAGQTCG